MSEAELNALMARHRASGVLLDTNLLLLYVIGLLDPHLLGRFKRTMAFTRQEYEWLAVFLAQFKRVVTTPTVLAEVNSLANQLPERNKPRFYAVFHEQIGLLEERYEPSRDICTYSYFAKCGLTDTAIMSTAQGKLLVLTTDARLAVLLNSLQIDSINFNHLRTYLLKP